MKKKSRAKAPKPNTVPQPGPFLPPVAKPSFCDRFLSVCSALGIGITLASFLCWVAYQPIRCRKLEKDVEAIRNAAVQADAAWKTQVYGLEVEIQKLRKQLRQAEFL